MSLVVLKFGGASVRTPEQFAVVAEIVKDRLQNYKKVVVVVSAMGDSTDELLALAHKVHPSPPRREVDMLLSVGERISIALLAMALDVVNVPAISFTGSQSGIITSNAHADARIVDVRARRVFQGLEQGQVVIVAGFQGMSQAGEITTLGRGGSDTTAVALGIALSADRVEFFKDVDGIFDFDPRMAPHAKLLPRLSFPQALSVLSANSHQVLHARAVLLAEKNDLPLHVLPVAKPSSAGTWIGPEIRGQNKEFQWE